MHDERVARAAANLCENVEVEMRLALVDAVYGSERAGQNVEARLVYESRAWSGLV